MIVTPFAQILASLRNVRNNYMRLTNLSGIRGREYRRSSTTYSPAAQIIQHNQQTHPLSQSHRTSTSSINPTILSNLASTTTGQIQQQQTTPITTTTPAILSSNNNSSVVKEQPTSANQQINQPPILTNQMSTSSCTSQQSTNDQTINWNLVSQQSNANTTTSGSVAEKMAIDTLEGKFAIKNR